MALVMSIGKFQYPAPNPDDITKKIFEITGLNAKCLNYDYNDYREYSCKLFFENFPEEKVNLYTYRMGAIKELDDSQEKKTGYSSSFKTEGYDDFEKVQRVYIQGYLGQELTIFNVASVALQQLGGEMDQPIDKLSKYNHKITEEDLKQRYYRKRKPLYFIYTVLQILFVPFFVIWSIITLPYTLYKTHKIQSNLLKKNKD